MGPALTFYFHTLPTEEQRHRCTEPWEISVKSWLSHSNSFPLGEVFSEPFVVQPIRIGCIRSLASS